MNKVVIGHLNDVPEKRGRIVRWNGIEIALFKLSDGTVRAVENSCPHKGGKLSEGIVCGNHVFCPLHDWKISLDNGLVQAPDEGCVSTFKVEVDKETGRLLMTVNDSDALVS